MTRETSQASPGLKSDGCGCAARPKRLCDECEAQGRSFTACGLACLDRHRAAAHDNLAEDSLARAHRQVRRQTARLFREPGADVTHRSRLMALLAELPLGAELCVFGAGGGQELELEQLADMFNEIHLVDLDAEAANRARDLQTARVRTKIVIHERVDASGVLDQLDAWGERFPDRAELARVASEAAQSIVHGLGVSFPAVVSNCLLSQLVLPFQRAWLTSRGNWTELLNTLQAIHLATLAGSTRSGGRCLLAVDVASSRETPALAEQRNRDSDELAEFVVETRAAGGLHPRPDPLTLIAQLSSLGMKSLVAEPRLSAPWLRQRDAESELVYGVTFGHP